MTTAWRLLVVGATVLLASAATPVPATASPADSAPRAIDGGADVVEGTTATAVRTNNSTRHVDPDEANERSDMGSVRQWLAGRMSARLQRSSVQLRRGEYERARSVVGDDYDDLLRKYVDVAGETGGDDSTGQFEQARETQDAFVSRVRAYRQTREEYREAKRNGNETRARQLARELERQAESINETGTKLQHQYDTISNTSDVDVSEGTGAVESVRTNVTEQQEAVRTETFVETRLSLATASDVVSFTEPLAATGRLVTANGTAVANRSVRFRVGERTVATRTDDDGRFSLTYRPTTMATGEQSVPIRYVPANASVYLGSEANATVSVEQVQPDVTLSTDVGTVGFGDRLVANGSVTAQGVGAAGVPVVVTLGDERLGRATTRSDGSFTLAGRVPAAVDAGDRELSVRVPLKDSALASTVTSTSVPVGSTGTALSVEAAGFASDGLRVTGSLATTDGRAVPDRRVSVALAGTTLGTVSTGANGSFSAVLAVPGRLRPDSGTSSLELVATFDGEATNLEGSRAGETVRVPASDGPGEGGDSNGVRLSLPLIGAVRASSAVLVLLGGGALGALVGGLALRRRRGPDGESGRNGVPATEESGAPRDDPSVDTSAVDLAAHRLDEGATDAAVEAAYAAVRRSVATAVDASGASTHWEFLRASREAGVNGDEYDALEALTEQYERAAFAPGSVPVDVAEQIVDTARCFGDIAR